MIKNREDLESKTLAQDDDNDYEESGYICVIDEQMAYLAKYNHCSCYGTWTSLCKGGVSDCPSKLPNNWYLWSGSSEELQYMAENRCDPILPDREATSADCDYDHLMNVYKQIRKAFHDHQILQLQR